MSSHEKDERAPVFITGVWRSGTTLISRIMNNHHDIHITYDTVHFLRFSLNKYDPIDEEKSAERLILDTSKRLYERYGIELSLNKTINDINGTYSYSSIYNSIMNNLFLKKKQKRIWGEKTNLAWKEIPDFLSMFPEGRVIHIIRDPRAVLSSWMKFTHAPENDYLDSILNSYDSMEKALEYNKNYSDKRYVTIKYEDLVRDPEGTIKHVCNCIDIEYDKNMLDVNMFADLNGQRWQANSVHDTKIEGISTTVIDRWKDELEDWQIMLTETIIGVLLHNFNYLTTEICNKQGVVDKMIDEILKSNLTTDGLVRYLLTNKGFERYPSDPLIKDNWD